MILHRPDPVSSFSGGENPGMQDQAARFIFSDSDMVCGFSESGKR